MGVVLPERQEFGVSVCFLQHSFDQLFVLLRIHRAGAVHHRLNLLDWRRGERGGVTSEFRQSGWSGPRAHAP